MRPVTTFLGSFRIDLDPWELRYFSLGKNRLSTPRLVAGSISVGWYIHSCNCSFFAVFIAFCRCRQTHLFWARWMCKRSLHATPGSFGTSWSSQKLDEILWIFMISWLPVLNRGQALKVLWIILDLFSSVHRDLFGSEVWILSWRFGISGISAETAPVIAWWGEKKWFSQIVPVKTC